MKLVTCLIFSIFLFFQTSCDTESHSGKKNPKPRMKDGVAKSFYKGGKLHSEIVYKDGKKTGKAIEYYKNGGKSLEIDYKNGIKHGNVKRFFENGQLSELILYVDGKKNGVQKKWRENGKLVTEAPYMNDLPCQGLKEYLLDGSIKMNYPSIIITPINKLDTQGLYILRLTLSNKSRNVSYAKGILNSECISDALDPIFFDENTGVGEIRYYLSPGEFKMEEINIIAKVKTLLGNVKIIQKSYNVAIDN